MLTGDISYYGAVGRGRPIGKVIGQSSIPFCGNFN